MRRDPRYPQYQPVIKRQSPDERTNPRFGRKSVAGGVGAGGAAPAIADLLRITGGNTLTVGATVLSGLMMAPEKPVPLANYSPTATANNWPDGIGRALRMNPDGTTTPVLVTNWFDAPSMISGFLITGTPITAAQTVTLVNEALDISITAYLVRNV